MSSITVVVPLTSPVKIPNGPNCTIRIEPLRTIVHSQDHRKAVEEHQIHPTSISMVSASYEEHLQVALALSWLCATFRSCPTSFYSSEVRFNEREPKTVQPASPCNIRRLAPLLPPYDTRNDETSCWQKLFKHTVVATHFPIPPRSQGMGLEISFADMTLLARSLHLVEYDLGLVAEGLSTLLIPVKELKGDDAVQWHLEGKFRTDSHGKLRKLHASQILRQYEFLN